MRTIKLNVYLTLISDLHWSYKEVFYSVYHVNFGSLKTAVIRFIFLYTYVYVADAIYLVHGNQTIKKTHRVIKKYHS